jgi:DNA-binding NarL/FixJ family response regulator
VTDCADPEGRIASLACADRPGVTILVVDDHLLVREGLKSVLKQIDRHVEVFEAGTAAEAFEIAKITPDLDLILLDLGLPDLSGKRALSEFRRNHSDVPVVVLSASMDLADVMRCIQDGAAGFIPKSSTAGVTLGALRLVLGGGVYLPPDILLAHEALQNQREQPSAMDIDAAESPRPGVDVGGLGLSNRQAQVLALLVQGKSNKAIGRDLDLAEQTVKAHISAAMRALNVTSRTQAVIAVGQLGLDLGPYLTSCGSGLARS